MLAAVYASSRKKAELAADEVELAYTISRDRPEVPELIKEIIR